MNFDKVLQATLLLAVFFNKREVGTVKPLTPLEYGRFAAWLHQKGLSPSDLLGDPDEILSTWNDPKKKITSERVKELLARGASMGFAIESWQKQGVWVVSRSSKDYPLTIREKLKDARPPVLFGVGDRRLLNKRGLGFVGSRSIDDSDSVFTEKLACEAVEQGYIVVSGGAKGIDQTAMTAAINHGGSSIGVLADSLLKASTLRIYREAIQEERLVLISPYYPEAGFSAGNAMGRNKYIYTLSDAVVVVKSDYEKGGTWAGAIENLKKSWVPLLVRESGRKGNEELIKLGATPVRDDQSNFQTIISEAQASHGVNSPRGKSVTEPTAPNLFTDQMDGPEAPSEIDGEENGNGDTINGSSELQSPVKAQLPESPVNDATECCHIDTDVRSISSIDTLENSEAVLAPKKVYKNDGQTESDDFVQIQSSLKNTPMSEYGEIFRLFLRSIIKVVHSEGSVTPTHLEGVFPELPTTVTKKWLAELEEHNILVREGRKLSYILPAPDLFQ